MTVTLAPRLFDRRFQDLIELGRARLRPLAPEWTDHNAHDPGITLMELLAWVSEAQLYAVGHLRRDERAAFASLLGLADRGTRAAAGVIWPDTNDPAAPASAYSRNVLIGEDAAVHVVGDEELTFRPVHNVLWTPGRVTALHSRTASGKRTDLTAMNARGATPFFPFGGSATRGSVLSLSFSCRDEDGLFGRDRRQAVGAVWTIGVLAAPSSGDATSARSPLTATLVAGGERFPMPIVADSSRGMLASGAIVFDVSQVPISPRDFSIELAAARGLPRPPRVLRIGPNVIPVRQGRAVDRELKVATGVPDWSFSLDLPGVRFEPGLEPVKVEVWEDTGLKTWTRTRQLADSGPEDRFYEIDASAGRVTFGNGINGRIPPALAQVLVSYAVSDGEAGNLGPNRRWSVAGFSAPFGANPEPIAGGAAAAGALEQRREARRRTRDDHALVSADDVKDAAIALPLLDVARAWVAVPGTASPRTGETTLIAVRRRHGEEQEAVAESSRWLEAIRRRLAPRMPLGSRLVVRAPHYVDVIIRAALEAEPGRAPEGVSVAVRAALEQRFAVVPTQADAETRDPGDPVTRRDVAAWIRSVSGVRRITSLELLRSDGRKTDRIDVRSDGLPRWLAGASRITVTRPSLSSPRSAPR